MRLFPIIFLLTYSFMHLFIVFKAKNALNLKPRAIHVLIIFSIFMIFMPIFLRLYRFETHWLIDKLYFGSFLWVGFIFLFFCLLLVTTLYTLILKIWKYLLRKDFHCLILPSNTNFILALLLAVILSIYGLFEANNIKIEKVTINTYKLPPSVDVFRIVHISDVHLGPLVKERKLREMIKLIEKASPDILVATGDIVDGQINNHPDYIKPFLILNPRYGKYAVLGNHELYVGLEQSIDYLQKAGFMVLRNEGFSIQGIINIAGIDDPSVKFFLKSNISEKNILSKLSQGEFTIFLKHRPIVSSDYIDLFDLQLSGHSHKGQIFPLNLITKFYYDVHGGLARLSDRSYIYVSRGVGTSGPPIRILSPPEITVIDIVRKQ